jgi:hypothetical protein
MGTYTFPLLARLLDYELRCAKRYRRDISLVLIGRLQTTESIAQLLGAALRDSDELIELENGAAIIMTETTPDAAEKAVERMKALNDGASRLQFTVLAYPRDAKSAQELLDVCSATLKNAASEPLEGGRIAHDIHSDSNGRGAGIRYVDSLEGYW